MQVNVAVGNCSKFSNCFQLLHYPLQTCTGPGTTQGVACFTLSPLRPGFRVLALKLEMQASPLTLQSHFQDFILQIHLYEMSERRVSLVTLFAITKDWK